MLKFKQTTSKSISNIPMTAKSNLSKIECFPCKASIIIHSITIPLAWPASEYFDHKGEWREFNVCLSFKAAGGKLMRSKIHQRVNRTITDLQFDENFTFHDLDPNFTIEALVSAKRINSQRSGSSPFQSVANTVSRSFGRRFGANYKKYSQAQNSYTISAYNFPSREEIFSSPVEDLLPIGRCFFRLENAGLSGKIRVYSLALVSVETIDRSLSPLDILPLFGTMCCQVLCRPDCLETTFIRSVLDIFYVDEQLLLEKLDSALEGGCIKCYTKDKKEAALVIPIDQKTNIRSTAYQTAIRITLLDEETQYTRDFIFILTNESQVNDWFYALQQQIKNAIAWKEFASVSTNPFALKYNNEFKLPIDEAQSIKGRTMTNTDEIKSGMREASKRGSRRRVQSVFQNVPKIEIKEEKKVESKDYDKPMAKSPSIHKPTQYLSVNQYVKQPSMIQKPKIVESKPMPRPRIIDPPPLTSKSSTNTKLLVNHGYVSSQTKTISRIARKQDEISSSPTQRNTEIALPRTKIASDFTKASSLHAETKSRQKVKLEYQEDTIERNIIPPETRHVSRPRLEDQRVISSPTSRPSLQNHDSIKGPPNTYIIRLNVGMDDDYEDTRAQHYVSKKPPPYPSHSHHNSSKLPPSSQKISNDLPKTPPPFRQKMPQLPPPLMPQSKSPKIISFKNTEITRL